MNNSNLTRSTAQDAAQMAQRRKKARKIAGRYKNQHIFLRRTYYALWLPIITALLYLFGLVPLFHTVAVWIFAIWFLLDNTLLWVKKAYRNRK